MLACAFVAEFVDAQVVKTLGFLGVVGSSPTARAVLRLRAVAEQTQIGRCPRCWHVPSFGGSGFESHREGRFAPSCCG